MANNKGKKNCIIDITKNYKLCYDSYCMWIEERRKGKNQDGCIVEIWVRVAGYSRNFQQLFNDFVTYQIKKSDTKEAKLFIRDVARKEKALYKFGEKMQKALEQSYGEDEAE